MTPQFAAYHEAAHAVACAVLGMPLQDLGIHIDTIGRGITFNLHRIPGDLNNAPNDVIQRERSIVMIKAGYAANVKLVTNADKNLGACDRQEECKLLDEMYPGGSRAWFEADAKLNAEAIHLVDKNWDAIRFLAQYLLGKPVTLRTAESFAKWTASHDSYEQWMDGQEVAETLRKFGLTTIVRKESDGQYHPPDL